MMLTRNLRGFLPFCNIHKIEQQKFCTSLIFNISKRKQQLLHSNKTPLESTKENTIENSHVNNKKNEQHSNEHHENGGVDGAKHQIFHRMKEKVGLKLVEKTFHSSVPRISKRLGKRIGVRLLGRLGRGFVIAIPALGGIFASIIGFYDFRRTVKEMRRKHLTVAYSFMVATVFDIIDAISHLHIAFGMAGFIEHSHFSENLSVFSAVIATSSAIFGELMMLNYVKSHDRLVSKVMIASSTGNVNSKMVESSSKQTIISNTEQKEEREPTPPTCW